MRSLLFRAFAVAAVTADMTVDEFKDACFNNGILGVRQWISEGNDVDHPINAQGDTCLMIAAMRKHVELIAVLETFGANVNAVSYRGTTALMMAITSATENSDTVAALIRSSVDVNTVQTFEVPFKHYSSPLSSAMGFERYQTIRLLLDAGATVTDWMMLSGVSHDEKFISMVKDLLTRCDRVKKFVLRTIDPKNYLVSRETQTMLVIDAARRGETELLRLLVQASSNVDLEAIDDCGILEFSLLNGKNEIVEILRSLGAT
jgi:hypothetical protein